MREVHCKCLMLRINEVLKVMKLKRMILIRGGDSSVIHVKCSYYIVILNVVKNLNASTNAFFRYAQQLVRSFVILRMTI